MRLAASLDRLEDISRQIGEVAAGSASDRLMTITNLRQEFNAECGVLLALVCNEQLIFDDPGLLSDLQEAIEDIKRRMSGHQARWTVERIEVDSQAYLRESRAVSRVLTDFIAMVRMVLRR